MPVETLPCRYNRLLCRDVVFIAETFHATSLLPAKPFHPTVIFNENDQDLCRMVVTLTC